MNENEVPRPCRRCGRPKQGRRGRYCSEECRAEAKHDSQQKRRTTLKAEEDRRQARIAADDSPRLRSETWASIDLQQHGAYVLYRIARRFKRTGQHAMTLHYEFEVRLITGEVEHVDIVQDNGKYLTLDEANHLFGMMATNKLGLTPLELASRATNTEPPRRELTLRSNDR